MRGKVSSIAVTSLGGRQPARTLVLPVHVPVRVGRVRAAPSRLNLATLQAGKLEKASDSLLATLVRTAVDLGEPEAMRLALRRCAEILRTRELNAGAGAAPPARARALIELACSQALCDAEADTALRAALRALARVAGQLQPEWLIKLACAAAKRLKPASAARARAAATASSPPSVVAADAGAAVDAADVEPLVDSLAAALRERADAFNLRQLARACWALGKLAQKHGGAEIQIALRDLCGRAADRLTVADDAACAPEGDALPLRALHSRELGLLAWAGARAISSALGGEGDELASPLAAALAATRALRVLRQRLLDPIAVEAAARTRAQLAIGDGVLIAWALARAEGWPLADDVQAPAGLPSEALARSHAAEVAFFGSLAARSAELRGLHTGQLLSLLWACATSGHALPALVDVAAGALAESADELTLPDTIQIGWALAALGVRPPALLGPICARLNDAAHAAFGSPPGVARDAPAPAAADAAARRAKATRARADGAELRRLLVDAEPGTAAPMASMAHIAWLALELQAGEHSCDGGSSGRGAARATAALATAAEGSANASARSADDGLRLSSAFCDVWLKHVQPRARGAPFPSALHNSISRALSHMSVGHVCELVVPERGYSVDIALSGRERVVVDVLGPSHYRFGTALKQTSAMKHRHLRKAGWHVLCVPWWEWPAGQGVDVERGYLRQLLSRRLDDAAERDGQQPDQCPGVGAPPGREAGGLVNDVLAGSEPGHGARHGQLPLRR
jgi:hypothetical protein